MSVQGSDCSSGKEQFAAKVHAQRAARGMRAARGAQVEAYRCQVCGTFHVGHRRRADKRKDLLGR